jgi:hypothetical protein
MNWKRLLFLLATAVLLLSGGVVLSQSSANFNLNWSTMAGGGGESTSATYRVEGSIGQSLTELSSSGDYRVQSGFWQAHIAEPSTIYLPLIMRE